MGPLKRFYACLISRGFCQGHITFSLVELNLGKIVTAEEIRSYMKGTLADFKILKHIIFIDRNESPLRPI